MWFRVIAFAHGTENWFLVAHGAEVPYVYGQVPSSDAAGQGLSAAMMDYWISFTVSLNPSDGKGLQRESSDTHLSIYLSR